MKFILARLAEPTTWRGLFLLATAAGVAIKPELQAAITSVGLALTGLVGVFVPDSAAE